MDELLIRSVYKCSVMHINKLFGFNIYCITLSKVDFFSHFVAFGLSLVTF